MSVNFVTLRVGGANDSCHFWKVAHISAAIGDGRTGTLAGVKVEVAGGRLLFVGSKLLEDAEAGDKLQEDQGDKLVQVKEASRALR